MSTNLYLLEQLELMLVKDAPMQDCQSKSSVDSYLEQALSGHTQGNPPKDSTTVTQDGTCNEETIRFSMEEEFFCIPPSFSHPLYEELLQMTLATQVNPVNPADAVFDYLANFVNQAMEEDKQFASFAYSEYTSTDDLLLVIDNLENLLEEPDNKPHKQYPEDEVGILQWYLLEWVFFAKFIKKLSPWCKEKCICGNWPCNQKNPSFWAGYLFN